MKKICMALFLALAIGCGALETYTVPGGYKETALMPGETFTIEAEIPPSTQNEKATLFFVARLKGKLSVDANHIMRINVDDKILDGMIQDMPRIVNRTGKTFHGTSHNYTENGQWNVASNPEEEYIEIIHVPEDFSNVFVYELDISDLPPGKHKISWKNNDRDRNLLIKAPKVQTRSVVETPYAPLRAFKQEAASRQLSIPANDGKAEWTFILPPVAGQRQVLRLRARLAKGAGGHNRNMRLLLNNQPIRDTLQSGSPRLLNRSNDNFRGDRSRLGLDYHGDYTVYHFASDSMSDRVKKFPNVEDIQHFWGYLDISDITKQGENVLTIINTAKSTDFGESNNNPYLVVELCEAGYVSEEAMEMLPAGTKRKTAPGKSIKKREYEITVQEKTFGIQIRRGKDIFFVDTYLSYPNGGMNSFYCAGAQTKKEESGWKPAIKIEGDTISITAQGKYYTFQRQLICKEAVIHVRDTIQSLYQDVLGVIYNNYLTSGTNPRKVYKHGACYPNTPWKGSHNAPAANSTMYVQLEQGGLGVFVEDDVFKLQCNYTFKGNLLNFKTEHLGFAPGASHTLMWNLYPQQNGDYFDFINKVRNYLGINNHTIPGAILWPGEGGKGDTRKQFMANLGMKIPAIYWFDYDSVTPQNATLEQRLAPCFREYNELKAFNPELKPIFMWQNNYTRCNYKNMPVFFADSCEVEPNGKLKMGAIGAGWRTGKDGYFTSRYFHVDNSYYKYAMEVLPKMLEKDILGVYFDTPNHIQQAYSRFTYDRWDNCTVDIDPATYTVTRQYADLCLVSSQARINIAKLIASSGKYMYYNNPPIINELMRLPNCVYMQEGDLDLQLGSLHLAPTPLCFGEHSDYNDPYKPLYKRRKTWFGAEDFMDDIRWKILNGVLYNTYVPPFGEKGEKISSVVLAHEWPVAYMFPITISDIHAGWIRGKERLITINSGTFGWESNGKTTVELRLFDKAGRNTQTKELSSYNGMFEIDVPEKGMAILIKK